jgi:hypothetical protein
VLEAAPVVRAVGVALGLATAAYASLVARAQTDAKGALAHATLAQVGLILAEICLGFTNLALAHLVGHALLRVWQYLRAPNAIHDAHRVGHHHAMPSALARLAPRLDVRLYAGGLHRFRVDEQIDRGARWVLAFARALDGVDVRVRKALDLDIDVPRGSP